MPKPDAKNYKKIIFLILFFVAAIGKSANSKLFSPFNRFELAYGFIDKQSHDILKSPESTWISLNSYCKSIDSTFILKNEKQALYIGITATAAVDYAEKSSRFGVLHSDVVFRSPIIDAHISAFCYSTENQNHSVLSDIQFERFIMQNSIEPISGVFDFRFNLPEAYLEAKFGNFTLSTGKKKLRWGPGYKGTLALSGTSYSPFYFYHLTCTFGNLAHMSAFLAGYEDETIYRKELTISEQITVKSNNYNLYPFLPRFGAGQRLDLRLGTHIQLGIYEMVDFFGSNDLNRFANPMQLYFLSNETSGTDNANLLGGIDCNVIFAPFRIYAEFLNDDITLFENTGNPNKYALQVGTSYYRDSFILSGIEYTHVAKYVYGHSRVLSRHSLWGESIGWPWGNFQDVVTAYTVIYLTDKLHSKIELNYWLKGMGSIEDEWHTDNSPDLDKAPFFPGHATKIYSMIFSTEYHPFPWLTYTFYYEPVIQNKKFHNEFYTYLQCSLPNLKNKITY